MRIHFGSLASNNGFQIKMRLYKIRLLGVENGVGCGDEGGGPWRGVGCVDESGLVMAVRKAFQRVFDVYDSEPAKTPQRALRLRAGVTDLLLTILDASQRESAASGDERVERVI